MRNPDLLIAVGVIGILTVMVIPLPAIFIDLLLSLSIAGSLVLLLTSVYVSRALEFSAFPTLLLIATLFRLSLNVATTRVILLRGGSEGTGAAGDVVRAFGEFVVGGNYAVGVVIFVILVIINFVVITKGAGRVAEVAARFTLDAMPGKQMAIDADLNAGVINEEEARRRRSEISREADFYGAMDGASKFVRGDAIAGILVVVVNVVGGIAIGVLQNGLDLGAAAQVFTLLTVGDGLVSQIPALITSTAAGIIVTRTASGNGLGAEFSKQLLSQPKSLYITASVMGFLGIIPGLPALPFFALAAGLGFTGYRIGGQLKRESEQKRVAEEKEKLKPTTEKLESLLAVDPLELEVGYGLIRLVDAEQKGDLLERISNIRKQFASDLGLIIPPIRIRDNLELKPGDYSVLLRGIRIGGGSLMVGHYLAMDPGNVDSPLAGIKTTEPAFGLDALWINEKQRETAIMSGYTVVDLSTVIATHLTELVRSHTHELLGRQELQTLLDALKQAAPKVVDELIPGILPVGTVLKVLRNLLREGVSIRDLRTILETCAEHGPVQKDSTQLTELVRAALARTITRKLVTPEGDLKLLTLDKTIEETVAQNIVQTEQGPQLSLDPDFVREFVSRLNDRASEFLHETQNTVVLCSPVIRAQLKALIDRFIPGVFVLSHAEITPNVQVRSLGMVRMSHAG